MTRHALTDSARLTRVGVLSPNLVLDIPNYNKMVEDPREPWLFDVMAKKASLLFDKIFLTENLELTCELVESDGEDFNPRSGTLRYLAKQGLLLAPEDVGWLSGEDLLRECLKGCAAQLHARLMQIGNPTNNDDPEVLVGQPDIGDWEAHDGTHPRSNRGWNDPRIARLKDSYESLLLRRNAAILREAGIVDVTIVGKLEARRPADADSQPIWNVIIREMPQLDVRAPWDEVLGFRAEERTRHLTRSLRRWVRKIVAEKWTETELQDEILELVYEYEKHMQRAHLAAGRDVIEFTVAGTVELAEDLIKMRLAKLAKRVTALINNRLEFLRDESAAPGRELALLPELKRRF